jgi:hypothetical protein
MNATRFVLVSLLAGAFAARAAADLVDRLDEALSVSAFDDRLRARLSGTLDVEGYAFSQPAPALLQADRSRLLDPRLTLFLDAQLGARTYFFAQARVDRGFDPGDEPFEARLDEYALRVALADDARVNVQVGKFATVVGNWTTRHNSWTNPFVTAPLPYENLTGMWDAEPPRSGNILLQWSHVRAGLPANITEREKYLRLPIVWGPAYASGAAVSGRLGVFRYAVEVKHAALSSRPEAWTRQGGAWSHPTVSGRIGLQPDPMWNFGLSASAGSYLRPSADPTLAPGRSRGDYRQLVLAHDASFAWHHWQVWAEIFAARFEVPGVGHADTAAYYVETKYKLTPRLFGALRWNEQLFATIPDRGGFARWGRNVARLDFALGFRPTAHTQLKLQYNLQRGDTGARGTGHLATGQFTLRF